MTLRIGEPIDARLPWVRRFHDLDEARATRSAGPKLEALRRGGFRVGDALRDGPRVACVRTLPITTLLYPTKYAFHHAVPLPWPFVVMTHRCLLVQVRTEDGPKNVLWNPTDADASRATPYFRKLIDAAGGEARAELLRTDYGTVESQLAKLGLTTADIDLIAFDHFHTQDLRPALGCSLPDPEGRTLEARFPNALLLAPRVEWEDWDHLHPLQRAWFIEDGKRGVPEERVVLTDGDLLLGEGCAVLRTPGHTSGNQTLFAHADRGVFGCSENGTSADSWAPYESRIPGLSAYARHYEVEAVLNSNTPELGAEQYTSMILEQSVVDRVPEKPAFVQMFPSSEVTPSYLAPGVRPSVLFRERDSGTLLTARAARAREDAPVEASAS